MLFYKRPNSFREKLAVEFAVFVYALYLLSVYLLARAETYQRDISF